MTTEPKKSSSSIVWTGRPWITPDAIVRIVFVLILSIFVFWLELYFNFVTQIVLGGPFWAWTTLLMLVALLVALVPLLVMRVAHLYTLRNDGLEVKTGIISLRTFVLAPIGFSNLQINQSALVRIVNSRDISVRTQGERSACMQKVKDTNTIVSLIRDVMGKPIVRIQGQPYTQKE